MTASAPAPDLIVPTWHTAPEWSYTLGPEVAELVALTSTDRGPFILDPEQRLWLDDVFGYMPDDRLAAFECGIIACRQNLKTGALKAAALGKLYVCEQRLVVWSAHEFAASREAFRDLMIMLESAPDLEREVVKAWTGAGSEAIEFTGDRRLIFKARHAGSARSLSGDTVILDEGYALMPEHMGALVPTLAARPDPQLLIGSSAGMAKSAVLRSLRDRGRRGSARVAYAEWCADERECPEGCSHVVGVAQGCALDDEDLRRQANTAIARGRITLDTVEGMRQSMPPEQFRRECIGWWDEPAGEDDPLIPDTSWRALEDHGSQIVTDPVFILDAAPLSTWAVLLAAGENAAGRVHVEITSREGRLDYRPGVLWVVPRVRQMTLTAGLETLHVVKGSAAEALIPALEREWTDDDGVTHPGVVVEVMPTADYLPACQGFVTAVAGEDVAHLGQPELAGAVTSGVTGSKTDKGLWFWGRVAPTVDIAPLVAATAGFRLVRGAETYDPLDNIF